MTTLSGTLRVHASYGVTEGIVGPGSLYGVRTPIQRHTFYAKSLHWAFYTHNSAIHYGVSSDGINWTEPVYVASQNYIDFFCLYWDGQYIHYVLTTHGNPIYYRRGLPSADGSIAWTPEVTIPVLDEFYSTDPTISVDSQGYPWIGAYGKDELAPIITKSDVKDGTWRNAPGFPMNLAPTTGPGMRGAFCCVPIPLTGGKVYAVYFRSFRYVQKQLPIEPVYGRLWNGSSWLPEEQASQSLVGNEEFHLGSIIGHDDEIHMVFQRQIGSDNPSNATGFDLVYIKRDAFGWQQEEIVIPNIPYTTIPGISYSEAEGTPYIFWNEGDTIYYRIGVWGDTRVFASEQQGLNGISISPSYRDYGGVIGVLWSVQSAEGLLVKYKYLSTGG